MYWFQYIFSQGVNGKLVFQYLTPPHQASICKLGGRKSTVNRLDIFGVAYCTKQAIRLRSNVCAGYACVFLNDQIYAYAGGMEPFAKTKAERMTKGDQGLSLEKRYTNHADYLAVAKKAAAYAVAQKFLLWKHADALIAAAEARGGMSGTELTDLKLIESMQGRPYSVCHVAHSGRARKLNSVLAILRIVFQFAFQTIHEMS